MVLFLCDLPLFLCYVGILVCLQALEEIFKTQLNNITSNTKTISTPELSTVRYGKELDSKSKRRRTESV